MISPYVFPLLKHFMLDKKKHPYLTKCKTFTTDELAELIISETNAPVDFRQTKNRKRSYVEAKKLYCKICVFELHMTLSQVGDTIYGYDHSDVIHCHRSFDNLYKTDDVYRSKCDRVLNKLHIKL